MALRVRLRDLLEQRGMTQVELQMQTGLSYSTINELHHGKTRRVEFSTLDLLCSALGCKVGDLIEYVPERKRAR